MEVWKKWRGSYKHTQKLFNVEKQFAKNKLKKLFYIVKKHAQNKVKGRILQSILTK